MKRYVVLEEDLEGIEVASIIDTETNTLFQYCRSDINKLCDVLNMQDTKWQKLKEWLEENKYKQLDDRYIEELVGVVNVSCLLDKMQELEGEDE